MLRKIDWESQIGRRLRLRDLHVFETVIQRGSMAKAAIQLGVSQPAVSEVIADLEHALGVRLLDRSAKGVEPTIYGDALLKRSVAAFDELKQSVRDIAFLSNPTEGELRIGCTNSLATTILPRIISRFSGQYPGVEVHFDDVGDRATEELGPGLRDRKFDCVLQRIVLPLPGHLADDIDAEVLFDDELIVAAGGHTQWARRRSIDLAELIDEPWILPPPGTWYHAFVSKLFHARGLEMPKPGLVTHSIALRARLLAEGRYLTTFASSVVRLNADRYALKILPVDLPVQSLPAGILTLKNRTLSPIVERFRGIARAVAKPPESLTAAESPPP
jgi:DNA-binding transcriptional LysR family regulator